MEEKDNNGKSNKSAMCPVCDRLFNCDEIESHVNKCIFLNMQNDKSLKRTGTSLNLRSPQEKKMKLFGSSKSCINDKIKPALGRDGFEDSLSKTNSSAHTSTDQNMSHKIPLAEQMRPSTFDEYLGQDHVLGQNKMLRSLIEKKDIPSMILWGPPGCGKTSLAHVVSSLCKVSSNMRFVKLSATMSGINDVKEVVKVAANEAKFQRRTILFMDEIHRFNKLQQDAFLPHVENGTIILIGATTENPSFSLNSALLSRCRVIILEKLSVNNIVHILEKALLNKYKADIIDVDLPVDTNDDNIPRIMIEKSSIQWLAEVADGDARIALSSLQLAVQSKDPGDKFLTSGPGMITLDDIKDGIKRSHILYDRKGDEHYNIISALHKSIRASDDNAALYWLTRMMEGGEDPIFIARRLVRAASEDIGLADSQALQLAVSCMQGCQMIGMPECNVLLAHCAVYLARAPKSQEVYRAMLDCQRNIKEYKGPLPTVPLHLRNAPTKLMKDFGYGKGYNMRHKDESNLNYMPEGLEDVNFLGE